MEILNIKERNPADKTLRRNPITRDYFSLDKVIPAPEATDQCLIILKKVPPALSLEPNVIHVH